jgi:arylsulfatase
VTAEIVAPEATANGVLIAQGGAFAGWSLYVKDGAPKYCYNLLGVQRYYVESAEALNAGEHQVRLEFDYDGDGLAKGGTASLYIDGAKVGEGRIEHTVPLVFSADETADVGSDTGTAVTPDYSPEESHFNGKINWVQIDVGVDDQDHLISPEERLRVAMARQ